jgi:prepilin-type N-terminal cleavage/methylation domain-containing protein
MEAQSFPMKRTHPLPPPGARRAFTLVEILAVLAVIAAIIAVGVPAISKVLQSSRIRNAEGTAGVLKSAITQFLSKPGSPGTLPVTEGTVPASEYVTAATILTAANIANGATLDNILLSEGMLERPIAPRMGQQGGAVAGVPPVWSPSAAQFTGPASGTLASYAAISRVECAVCDGASNPGATGQAVGSAACAFNLSGTGALIPAGDRVAYLIIKSAPVADAYQLALDVDGPSLTQNTPAAPAGNDQSQGPVAYARDAGATGFVDVYYYLTHI